MPVIYSFEDHQIDPENIAEEAKSVIRQLRRAGFEAYIVGGGVRDLCLGKKPKDFDIATSAQPEQIKPLFRHCLLIGRRFRLAHVRFKKMIIEVATFRSGDPQSEDLITHDNTWGNPEEDALRRDFTLNGLFYNLEHETIIDYVGGFEDLKQRHLRTIGDPILRFRQDPVRMIRLLKFQARYPEMQIDPATRAALHTCRYEIVKSSPARLLEELLRMLESGSAASFFQLMFQEGLLEPLMPHLDAKLRAGDPRLIDYLRSCDELQKLQPLSRDVLFASLVYSLIESQIATSAPRSHELALMADEEIEAMTGALRHLPRRMKAVVCQLIALQPRLSPFHGKMERRPRARTLHHPDFGAALSLLQVRSLVHPELQEPLAIWQQASADLEQPAQNNEDDTKRTTGRHRAKRRGRAQAQETTQESREESSPPPKTPPATCLLPPPAQLIRATLCEQPYG